MVYKMQTHHKINERDFMEDVLIIILSGEKAMNNFCQGAKDVLFLFFPCFGDY
jgi:hypothetical protein